MNLSTAHYIDQCHALASLLPGQQSGWLQAQRSAGLARFKQVGFPTQRDEDWRYTSTKRITDKTFNATRIVPSYDSEDMPFKIDSLKIETLKSHRLVFVDGVFAPEFSDPGEPSSGVLVKPLAGVLEEHPELLEHAFGSVMPRNQHGFTALNNACSRDGVAVVLEPNARTHMPVEILCISYAENGFSQPRNLVIASDSAKAQLIERYVSVNEHNTFTNSATEILLGENAEIDYYLVQTQSSSAYHVCGVWAKQARASRFRCRTITLGGALVRNDLCVKLAGEQAHCDMLGLYTPGGVQHVDNHTTIIHDAENCTSRELYKGVLAQRSRAVFHGRIKVEPGAQQTNAAQTNNNLLLSPHVEIDTKPQLEIYADEVKCSHGATVGRIDDDALFYLRTRGIAEDEARSLLTFSFLNDVVYNIEVTELRDLLEEMIATHFRSIHDHKLK